MRAVMAFLAASMLVSAVACGSAGSGGTGAPQASAAPATPTKLPLPSATPADTYGY